MENSYYGINNCELSHISSFGTSQKATDAVIKLYHRHTGRVAHSGRLSAVQRLKTCLRGIYGNICVDPASDKFVILMEKHLCTWRFRTDDWLHIGLLSSYFMLIKIFRARQRMG